MNKKLKRILFTFTSILLLCLSYSIHFFGHMDCGMPFGSCYYTWVEVPMLLSLFCWGIIILYTAIVEKNQNRAKTITLISVGITVAGSLCYFIYHSLYHDFLTIMVWKHPENVMPYHVQLGKLFFFYVAIINFIILFQKQVKLWIRLSIFLIPVAMLLLINFQKKAGSHKTEEQVSVSTEASTILRLKIIKNNISPFYDLSKTSINAICSVDLVLKGKDIERGDTVLFSKEVYISPEQLKTDTLERLMKTDMLSSGKEFIVYLKDRDRKKTEYYDSIFQHMKRGQYDISELNGTKFIFQKMKEFKLIKRTDD